MPADVILASVAEQVALKFLSTVGETIGDPLVLSDAQIKALPTTPIELVPAPAAGRMLVPFGAILIAHIQSAYTNIDNASGSSPAGFPHLFIGTNDGAGMHLTLVADAVDDGLLGLSDLLATGGDRIAVVGMSAAVPWVSMPRLTAHVHDLADVQEVNIALGAFNADGDFAGGHANNSLAVIPIYLDIEVP